MNRRSQAMTVEMLGKIVLIVLIAIAVIVFIVVGVNAQAGAYNQTSSSIIGNLSGKANAAKDVIIQ